MILILIIHLQPAIESYGKKNVEKPLLIREGDTMNIFAITEILFITLALINQRSRPKSRLDIRMKCAWSKITGRMTMVAPSIQAKIDMGR